MSVPNILSKLQQINNSNVVSVFVPSQNKELSFRPLSIKQQKDLIKTSMDGNLSGITFSNTINQILIDNSIEKCRLLVTDRHPVIVSLRKQAFGAIFELSEGDKKISYDLMKILSKRLEFSEPESIEIMLKDTDLSVKVDVPSLEDDIKINNLLIDKIKKDKTENISETVGDLFLYEILKFVNKLFLGSEETDLTGLSIKDRVSVIESLPVTLNTVILEYIQNKRKEESEYLTVDGETLPLDPRFFSKE